MTLMKFSGCNEEDDDAENVGCDDSRGSSQRRRRGRGVGLVVVRRSCVLTMEEVFEVSVVDEQDEEEEEGGDDFMREKKNNEADAADIAMSARMLKCRQCGCLQEAQEEQGRKEEQGKNERNQLETTAVVSESDIDGGGGEEEASALVDDADLGSPRGGSEKESHAGMVASVSSSKEDKAEAEITADSSCETELTSSTSPQPPTTTTSEDEIPAKTPDQSEADAKECSEAAATVQEASSNEAQEPSSLSLPDATAAAAAASATTVASVHPRMIPISKWQVREGEGDPRSFPTSMPSGSTKRRYDAGSLDPKSKKGRVTLQTKDGPIEVFVLPHKAERREGSCKFRCPVSHCSFKREGSRVFIANHFRIVHKDYRSWRDLFLRADAPPIVAVERDCSEEEEEEEEEQVSVHDQSGASEQQDNEEMVKTGGAPQMTPINLEDIVQPMQQDNPALPTGGPPIVSGPTWMHQNGPDCPPHIPSAHNGPSQGYTAAQPTQQQFQQVSGVQYQQVLLPTPTSTPQQFATPQYVSMMAPPTTMQSPQFMMQQQTSPAASGAHQHQQLYQTLAAPSPQQPARSFEPPKYKIIQVVVPSRVANQMIESQRYQLVPMMQQMGPGAMGAATAAPTMAASDLQYASQVAMAPTQEQQQQQQQHPPGTVFVPMYPM